MNDILNLFKNQNIVTSFTNEEGNYVCDSILKKALLLASSYSLKKKKYFL